MVKSFSELGRPPLGVPTIITLFLATTIALEIYRLPRISYFELHKDYGCNNFDTRE